VVSQSWDHIHVVFGADGLAHQVATDRPRDDPFFHRPTIRASYGPRKEIRTCPLVACLVVSSSGGADWLDAARAARYSRTVQTQLSSWNQGVPMPCSKCGAPMQVVADVGAHGAVALFCGYCHQREALPPDAAERVRYLQHRLALLK